MENTKKHKIFIILGIVLAIFLFTIGVGATISVINNQGQAAQSEIIVPEPTPLPRGIMWFKQENGELSSTPSASVITGTLTQPITLNLYMDADNRVINGFDAVISYDPKMLEIVSIEATEEADSIFTITPRDDEINETAIITGYKSQYDNQPTSTLPLITLTVQPLSTGLSTISLEFIYGSTNTSTIIQADGNENILDAVYPVTVTVE